MKRCYRYHSFFIVFLFSMICSIILLSEANAEDVRGVTDELIKIGAIIDQTGPAANIGIPLASGSAVHIRHINDQGGINGRKLKFILEDDHYSIPIGIAAFKKLVFKDNIFALIGPASVGESRTLFRQMEKFKLPTIVESPDYAAVTPFKRYVFMPVDQYEQEMGVSFEYILKDLKAKEPRITYVYYDKESGKICMESAKKWAKVLGLKNMNFEVLPLGALDAASQVMSIKRKGVDYILIHHPGPGAVALLRSMKQFRLKVPVFGDIISCSEDVVRLIGESGKHFFATSPVSPWYHDSPGMKKLRDITLSYFPGTEKPYRNLYYTIGWMVSEVLCEGIKRAGNNLTAETLVDNLETLRNYDTAGLCGPINITSKTHQFLDSCKIFRADPTTGTVVPITNWREPPDM